MPNNPAQIAHYIRYSLSDLSARNAHHEFEHMCRHVAKLRISSNILSATGPVGAGGDGGRDFETFKTDVTANPLDKSRFAALSSGRRPIAFACTLQRDVEPKIREDVSRLAADRWGEIAYFCEANLPVGRRQPLIHWAKLEHAVDLQIFDGQALSEMLSDRDIYWVGQQYLNLPDDLMPPPAEEPESYRLAVEKWKSVSPLPLSFADFFEIKAGLRRATFDPDSRPDLNLWMEKARAFLSPPAPRPLVRAAAYQLAVASFRGKQDMSSEIERMRDYYADVDTWIAVGDLLDAAALAVYAYAAFFGGTLTVKCEELQAWRQRLTDCLEVELGKPIGSGRRSGLLRVRAMIYALPDEPSGVPTMTASFACYHRMLDEAEKTPLFPIETFADFLVSVTPMWSRYAEFPALTDRVDRLLAIRSGQSAAGERIFARARALMDQDQPLAAATLFHHAIKELFSGDSMEQFELACQLLRDCYMLLGLPYAAKYYALAAAHIATHTDDEIVAHELPTLLFAAADAEHRAGNSLGYLDLIFRALDAHCKFRQEPLDLTQHSELDDALGNIVALRGLAARLEPHVLKAVDTALDRWPQNLRELIVRSSSAADGFWNVASLSDVRQSFQDYYLGRPFGDLAPERTVAWQALGISWQASFKNDWGTVPHAEKFIAQLQIGLVSIANIDLGLLPTRIHLRLAARVRGKKALLERVPHETAPFGLSIKLPASSGVSTTPPNPLDFMVLIAAILRGCSLLSEEDFRKNFESVFKPIAERTYVGRPYEELYREFHARASLAAGNGAPSTAADIFLLQHPAIPELAWRKMPGPTYSAAIAADSVRGRYARAGKSIRYTIRGLMADARTRRKLEEFRNEGMKDWEILSIVANAVVNLRAPLDGEEEPTPQEIADFRAQLEKEERPTEALGADRLTNDFLDLCRSTFLRAFSSAWGLVATQDTDTAALERFLIDRYNLRSDDEPHEPLLDWAASHPALDAPTGFR